MRTIEVEWDIDQEEIELPTKVNVPEDLDDEEVSDWLSDEYGWCVLTWADVKPTEITLVTVTSFNEMDIENTKSFKNPEDGNRYFKDFIRNYLGEAAPSDDALDDALDDGYYVFDIDIDSKITINEINLY